ncbi:MAG: DUF349 domain-containing protein [Bacteroides sp.]|nr:DUF349 domain-containing protein [Bacteroides sp.]
MMDSQETNHPLNRGELEEGKKTVEISDTAETTETDGTVEHTEEIGTTTEAVEDTTITTRETNNVATEPEGPATEETVAEILSDEGVSTEKETAPEEIAPVEVVREEVTIQEPVFLETEAVQRAETAEAPEGPTPEIIVEEGVVKEEKKTAVLTEKNEILARLKELAATAEESSRQEVEILKQAFYKLHNAEQESARQAYLESGGAEEEYIPATDELEIKFKELINTIREKRSARAAELEKIKEENLQIKLSIIEELKELVESGEDTHKNFNEFKKLQQQWNEVKAVPQGKVNELWKNYHLYVEKFYDLLKLNNEFREYDFKKNLELKLHLCEAAEKLAEEPDVVSAFHQLQKLHQEFRDTGPVSKELREKIWTRFKAASTQVNRRHQQHFEELKQSEQHNLDQKTVICEIVEAIDYTELNSFATWDSKTREVIALQNKWKTIGFAPQKMNVKIFERFRKACDEFFRNKATFFKTLKEQMNENLDKKRALCEQAEALRTSTEWKETAEKLTRLQKEWKAIGPVSKKHSDAIWKRFISSCDYFFEQKGKATSSQRSVEHENLEGKKAIIAKLAAIESDMDTEQAEVQVKELMREWNTIGHVPFREKDKIYKQYHQWIDTHFEQFNLQASHKKLSNFRSNINTIQEDGPQSVYREREKLVRTCENMKNELKTYENSLGFLTASSKKGNSLLTEINRKVDKLKGELELVQEKIRMIDHSLKEEKE